MTLVLISQSSNNKRISKYFPFVCSTVYSTSKTEYGRELLQFCTYTTNLVHGKRDVQAVKEIQCCSRVFPSAWQHFIPQQHRDSENVILLGKQHSLYFNVQTIFYCLLFGWFGCTLFSSRSCLSTVRFYYGCGSFAQDCWKCDKVFYWFNKTILILHAWSLLGNFPFEFDAKFLLNKFRENFFLDFGHPTYST